MEDNAHKPLKETIEERDESRQKHEKVLDAVLEVPENKEAIDKIWK